MRIIRFSFALMLAACGVAPESEVATPYKLPVNCSYWDISIKRNGFHGDGSCVNAMMYIGTGGSGVRWAGMEGRVGVWRDSTDPELGPSVEVASIGYDSEVLRECRNSPEAKQAADLAYEAIKKRCFRELLP